MSADHPPVPQAASGAPEPPDGSSSSPMHADETGSRDITTRHKKLGRRTVWISVMTLVSRILGFVRETLSAALFGDKSAVFDAFITAWRIPNMLRRFLGEGALATSFQTALTEVDGDRGDRAGAALFAATAKRLFVVLVAVTVLLTAGVLWMPDHMPLTGWAWLGKDPAPVRELAAWLMPFLILVCMAALVGGALQVRGHFTTPALAPAAMNVVWIGALVFIAVHFGLDLERGAPSTQHMAMARMLAIGVLAAGAAQLVVQVRPLYRTGLLGVAPHPDGAPAGAVRAVLWRTLPMALGAAVYQINVMVDGLMAEGLLPDGGPTLHYYANRVQQFPLALVAVAATSAVFPLLKAHGHQKELGKMRGLYDRTHQSIAFFALPASVGLFVLAEPTVRVLFQHGAFGEEGVQRTTDALRMLCLAILPAGATGLCARSYYALGEFAHPVRISIAMLVLNMILNYVLIVYASMDVDGLALATAITSWGSLLLLVPGLAHRLPARERSLARNYAKLLVPAVLCGAGAWGAWVGTHARLWDPIALGIAIAVGGAAYFAGARAMGLPLRGR